MLVELHKWIIQAHALLWVRFRFEGDTPAKADRHQLESWILGEIFEPKQALPVLGRFSFDHKSHRTFGTVQVWIFKYLIEQELASTTSLAIIAIWFKNICPNQWKKRFISDDYFWGQAEVTLRQGNTPGDNNNHNGDNKSNNNNNHDNHSNNHKNYRENDKNRDHRDKKH